MLFTQQIFQIPSVFFYEKTTSSSPYDKNICNTFDSEENLHTILGSKENLCKFSKIFDIMEVNELKTIKNLAFRQQGEIKIFVNENESYTREVYDFYNSFSFFEILLALITSPELKLHRFFHDIKTAPPTYSSSISALFDEIDQIIIGVSFYINTRLHRAEKHNWISKWFILFCDNLIINFPEEKMKILDIKNKITIQKIIT